MSFLFIGEIFKIFTVRPHCAQYRAL